MPVTFSPLAICASNWRETSGSNVFDMKAGRLKESKSEMTMTGTMTVGVMGMEIDATLSQKVKTTTVVSDKNPVKD